MSRILMTVPTWNEERIIERNLKILHDRATQVLPNDRITIEVADNGSTDATQACVRRVPSIELFIVGQRGKGIAIRRSWERHLDEYDIFVFMDADLAADLAALPMLTQPIAEGAADIVCGSRFIFGSRRERAFVREMASNAYRVLQRLVLRLPVMDAQCGFKAVSRQAAQKLLARCQENGWMFDSELLFLAQQYGYRMREIPVQWIEKRDPNRRSTLNVFKDGWGFVAGLWRIRKRRDGVVSA